MSVARFALHHAKTIAFAVAVLAALGVRAYLQTPQSIFPVMSFSRIDVVANAGDLPPERVRIGVALPLEAVLQVLPGVARVQATSSAGSADVVVDFSPNTAPRVALEAVNAALSRLHGSLGTTDIVAAAVDPNKEPVLSYALTSRSLSTAILREFALHRIVPDLYGVPGLGRVVVTGGPTRELHVELDPATLAAYGLGAAEVAKAIGDANTVSGVGISERFYQRYSLLVDSSLHGLAALRTIGIPTASGTSVPLSVLGTVLWGVSPAVDQASYDGRHAVIVSLFGISGGDTVRMARVAGERLRASARRLPADVHVNGFWDQTKLVTASQATLRDAILLGALLAVIVIYLFLRDLRLTLVAATVIPLAMAIAVFALQATGQTLNLMSVGGLAVAVGLIIDDAIVVIENIARTLREHPELGHRGAVARAMSELTAAMTASTATTVVVFVPLALLGGVTGFFFRALAFTLAASLIVSLGLALFVAPNAALFLLRGKAPQERSGGAIARLLARYDELLRWSLAHRRAVYGGAFGVLFVTFGLLATLPSDFLPKMDEGQFEVQYALRAGTTLAATDAASQRMERIVAADPAVAAVGRVTGIDSNGYSPLPPNQGLLRVALKPESERAGYERVAARLRERLGEAIPSGRFDFRQILEDLINDLSGAPAPIEIAVRGTDLRALDALAVKLADRVGKIPGIVDAASGVVADNATLRVEPRATRLAALGLTNSDVADALAARLQGTVATEVGGPLALIPVRVFVGTPDGRLADLASAPLLAKGGPTALSDIARLQPQPLQVEESDENGLRVVRVTANTSGTSLSAAIARIRAVLAANPLPPGYTAEIGGQYAIQQASFRGFLSVIAVAVALVFSVMLATFRSYRLPLVILSAIPLSLIGVALALFVTRTPFNVSSFMGLLLLVGIVVKNGILLIDVANKRRAAGDAVVDSLVAAGKTRLRPIVMTTLAAIGGLLPLAFGIGQGSELERPLAIAVIGGLSTATIFTLVAIPVLYATFLGNAETSAALE